MNILSLLKRDHKHVSHLLNEMEHTTDFSEKTRLSLVNELKKSIAMHEIVEETIFYPTLKKYQKTHDLILEAYEEHHLMNYSLDELDKTDPMDETWKAKVRVLKETIKHHVDEEENKLFPKVENVLDPEELREMGKEMLEEKDAMKKSKV